MKRTLSLLLVAGVTAAALAGEPPRVFLSNPAVIAANRDQPKTFAGVLKRLRKDADKALQLQPVSVTQKEQTPPSGDKHDYLSLSKYWWPDPEKPDGKPYIRKDGQTNPETEQYSDPRNVVLVARAVATLGLAYYFTAHEPYAEHAALLTRVFFLDPATRMNPNMNFAQFIPGRSEGRGVGIIDTHTLPELLDGLGLIEGSPAYTAEDRRGMQKWCSDYLQWLGESKNGKDEAAARNNHGTWYDVQSVSLALFLGKTAMAKEILTNRSMNRLARQFAADGSQPEELARTKSWDYSFFNLAAWCQLAALGERAGVDLWRYTTADGRGIRAALDWLMPYVRGEKSWEAEQIAERKVTGLYVFFLRAAVAYPDGKFTEAAEKFAGTGGVTDRVHLLLPAVQK